jgi:hypothetical protein
MEHRIIVDVDKGTVAAEPNPLQDVRLWDSVTWVFHGLASGHVPLVVFREIHPLPPATGSPVPCGPLGPFERVSIAEGRFFGTGDCGAGGRFIYDVFTFDQGLMSAERLEWRNPGVLGNFGGLDRSGPPP